MRSAQVYKSIIDDTDVIFDALKLLANNNPKQFPRIQELQRLDNGDVEGILYIRKTYPTREFDQFTYPFLFRIRSKYLYLLGSSDARGDALNALNDLEGIDDSIENHEISKTDLVKKILEKLNKKDNRNFIKKINLEFGVAGISYYNNTPLYKLDYELIQNTCASTHQTFDQFINNAVSVKVKFGIVSLFGINRTDKSDRPAPMNMNMDFSVSFYFELDKNQWYEILDYLTCTTD